MQPSDLDTVYGWLNAAHVARWCGGAAERARFELDMMERMESDWVFPNIVMLGTRPVGYLQYFVAGVRADELGLADARGMLGMDLLLGEAALLGKGLGKTALRQAIELLFREAAIVALLAEIDPENAIGLRSYHAVGFRPADDHPPTARGHILFMLKRSQVPPPSG